MVHALHTVAGICVTQSGSLYSLSTVRVIHSGAMSGAASRCPPCSTHDPHGSAPPPLPPASPHQAPHSLQGKQRGGIDALRIRPRTTHVQPAVRAPRCQADLQQGGRGRGHIEQDGGGGHSVRLIWLGE